MKQYTILTGLTVLLAGMAYVSTASAETLAADSVVCIDKRYLKKYEGHIEKHEDAFANDMRDRAQCIINQRPYDVSILETSGDYSKAEVLNGTRIWVKTADLITDSAEMVEPAAE